MGLGEAIVILIVVGAIGGAASRIVRSAAQLRSARGDPQTVEREVDRLSGVEQRLMELEEGLDFAERMLSQQRERRLPSA